jgi:tetratricopeptide (TPR) repeat protein
MRALILPSLLLLLTFSAALLPAVEFRSEFRALEEAYNSGNLSRLPALLSESTAKNDEERALLSYLSAMLAKDSESAARLLQQTIDRYPSTYYGQMGMLERARIHIVERQIPQAQSLLQRINSTGIMERFYWLGYCSEASDRFDEAIAHCENYLRLDPRGRYLENAYYLIAGAYQCQKKYQSALSTLEKLRAIDGYPRNEQYFYYLQGCLYKLAGNSAEALQSLKHGFELNRKSPLAFEIEDELFRLRDKYGASIDLTFMYPYTQLDIPELEADTLATGPVAAFDPSKPAKLDAKPTGGYFVQVGRFSSETNAGKRTTEVRNLNLTASYFQDKGNKDTPWVVVIGPYTIQSEADRVRQILAQNSIDCFITRF